jgi:hypothetical protein
MRLALLFAGGVLLFGQQLGWSPTPGAQVAMFLVGVVLVGIPHGAADMLVASRQAGEDRKGFSLVGFLSGYLGRLLAFALVLYLFPVVGAVLFVLLSAYHFGETDLTGVRTDGWLGKSVVLCHGLVILGIILLGHPEEVRGIIGILEPSEVQQRLLERCLDARLTVLGVSLMLFFASGFAYFMAHPASRPYGGELIIRFAALALLVHFLPLILGFTFYFILWHSLLSLNDIIAFLRSDDRYSMRTILGRIALFSALAFVGIGVLVLLGSMYVSSRALLMSVILGLAVLTAPHIGIMHAMYARLRRSL